mmetsp:Transcript_8391/g.13272  ORF Transcript_8391/g.13272 Transcript_8391/m.13272 type:complete len:251 (-) Transcript_8391:1528-2280(-)
MSTTSETIPESWSSEDISGGSPTSSFSSFDAESPENSRRALIVNKMLDEDMPSTSLLEERVLPKINAKLPLQSDATGWLKYLLFFVLFCIAILLVGTEIGTRILLKNGVSSIVDSFASKVWSDPLVSTCTVFAILVVVGRSIVIDVSTFVMLLHGKRRRSLPENKHLIHAVVITQYKEVSRSSVALRSQDGILYSYWWTRRMPIPWATTLTFLSRLGHLSIPFSYSQSRYWKPLFPPSQNLRWRTPPLLS